VKNKIYKIFLNNRIEIIILIVVVFFGAFVRLKNLNSLSLWYDEGQVYLGVDGILKYGIPKLPSGNILYHTIFSFYLRVIPAILFRLNEFSLRTVSAIFGIFTIILIYIFTKDFFNKKTAIISAIVISINQWQIFLSRDARYFSEFQFFYLLSTYFFIKAFISKKENSIYLKIYFLISFLITGLINNAGFTLILLFIPLLVIKRRKFLKKDILIFFFLVLFLIIIQILHRIFFWKTGFTFFERDISSDNIIINHIAKYIKTPSIYYFTAFKNTFPLMFYVSLLGYLFFLINIFQKKFPLLEDSDLIIKDRQKFIFKIPIYSFIMLFMFWSNILVLSMTNIPVG